VLELGGLLLETFLLAGLLLLLLGRGHNPFERRSKAPRLDGAQSGAARADAPVHGLGGEELIVVVLLLLQLQLAVPRVSPEEIELPLWRGLVGLGLVAVLGDGTGMEKRELCRRSAKAARVERGTRGLGERLKQRREVAGGAAASGNRKAEREPSLHWSSPSASAAASSPRSVWEWRKSTADKNRIFVQKLIKNIDKNGIDLGSNTCVHSFYVLQGNV
jgi:hypothetical protein